MARRLEPGWNFSTLYLIKDSLAIMLEAAGLLEDAFREYFELEACYLEALKQGGNLAGRQFGTPSPSALTLQSASNPGQTNRQVLACPGL